jgi:hypothetical protein
MRLRVIILMLGIFSIPIVQATGTSLSPVQTISSYGAIDYSSRITMYFPHTGEGDFERFPFCIGDYQQDWDWANGYQMDAGGNLFSYSDRGNNPDVYIRQSTQHVQQGNYSAEFHLGQTTIPTHGDAKHCKLYEEDQREYPSSYLHPTDGQPEAYYSAWFWFPSDFAETFLSDYSWKLLMQWADREGGDPGHTWVDAGGVTRDCFPTIALLFNGGTLRFFNSNFYRYPNPEAYREKGVVWETGYTVSSIPKEQWVHIEVFLKMSSGFQVLDGRGIVWINEHKVLDVVVGLWNYWTVPGDVGLCWGIGCYGDASNIGSIWIDNVQVANGYIK